jgi:hypothetical protein
VSGQQNVEAYLRFKADDIDMDYLPVWLREKSGRLRGSVMVAGPLLTRFRKHISLNQGVIKLAGEGWIHISSVLRSYKFLIM